MLCDGKGFAGWPFRRSIDAAVYVHKDKHYYFFNDASYAARGYGAAGFASITGLEGHFANWPTAEQIAAFSPEPEPGAAAELMAASTLEEEPVEGIRLLIQTGHTDTVRHVSFLDANRVVSIGLDGIARIWDIETAKEIQHLGQYTNPEEVFAAVDPARRWLLLADTERVTQWDIRSLRKVRTYPFLGIHNMTVHDDKLVVLYPRMATHANVAVIDLESGSSRTIRVTHTGSDKVTRYSEDLTAEDTPSMVMYADYLPRSDLVVTTGTDAKIRLWSGERETAIFGLSPSAGRVVGGNLLGGLPSAVGESGGAAGDYAGQLVEGLAHASDRVVFSPDGSRVASAHLSGTVAIWNSNGERSHKFEAHEGRIHEIHFGPDGRQLLTAGSDGYVKIWDPDSAELLRTLTGHAGAVTAAEFSPDGSRVLTGGVDRSVRLWDENGAISRQFERRAPGVSFVRFHPDGRTFITADRFDPMVRRWNMSDATLESTIEVKHGGGISSMAVSADGALVAIGTLDRQVTVYRLTDGQMLWGAYHERGDDLTKATQQGLAGLAGFGEVKEDEYRNKIGIRGVDFTADGSYLYTTADNSHRAKMWNAATGEEIKRSGMQVALGPPIPVSPTGMVAISEEITESVSTILTWDTGVDGTGSGKVVTFGSAFSGAASPRRRYGSSLTALEFLPDGRRVIGAAGQDVAIWDIGKKERVHAFHGHEGDVMAIAVDAAGRLMASGSTDNMIVVSTADYHYTASKGATRGLAFVSGTNSYPFDQFDLQLNRPDLVLEKIGMADPALRRIYSLAAQKRLRKYGVAGDGGLDDTELPHFTIESTIAPSTTQKRLDLTIDAANSGMGAMIDRKHPLPIKHQAAALGMARSTALVSAPSKKSFSKVSSPIFACNAFTSIGGGSWCPLPSNTTPARSSNWDFHCVI